MFDIYLDLETYSATDLKASGVYRYVTDPDFMVLMAAYAFGRDAPVKSTTDPVMIRKLAELCADPANTIWAHNANFERVSLSAVLGYDVGHGELIDPGHWEDTQALAAVHGWPQSLERLAVAAGGEQKDTAGTRLINTFSKPNRKGERTLPEEKPQDWKLFLDYCVQDVVTLQDVAKFLPGWPTEGERQIWVEDQRINDRGIRVDTDMVAVAAEVADLNRIEQELEVTNLTGVHNPGSTVQLVKWLQDQGVRINNLRKETVQDLLDFGGLDPAVERVLELRQDLAIAASKKYLSALDRVSADGRLRGSFQYHGAHTGRWAGRGVQLQNLPRETLDEVDGQTPDDTIAEAVMHLMVDEAGDAHTLKALVRSMFLGPMTVVDYSAIEARVVAWLAGETWALEAFRDGRDIYVETACIARGSLVLTDHGEVPIEHVTRDMKVWDGVEWVDHDGVVYKGMREVIHYDGLSATEDHLVWIDGAADPIPFGEAAALGRRLTRSGAGATSSDQEGGVSVGRNRMHPVSLSGSRRSAEPSETGSPVVHSVPQRAFGAVSEISGPQTSVPVGPPELWRAGDTIQLLQHGSCSGVDVVGARHISGEGHRPDRQRGALRTGERPVGVPRRKHAERTFNEAEVVGPEILALRGGSGPSAPSPGDESSGHHTARSGRGSSARPVVEDRGEAVAVYDILNAGKRHRFTASGRLVHNCRMGSHYTRTDGKIATLALGYNGGVGSMMAMGAEGTPDELQKIVWNWRAANEHIVQMWRDMEDGFRYGDRWVGEHIYVERDENTRILWLPSGRGIGYHRVGQKWVNKTWPSGDTSRVRQLSFADPKIYPRRADTYGGRLVENVTQAVARDVLAAALVRLEDAGLPVIGHVHDEILVEGDHLDAVTELMVEPSAWMDGLPMAAEGDVVPRYRKI